MTEQPTITTERLILRPYALSDAPELQRLIGESAVALTTNIPHPYENGMAEDWINKQPDIYVKGTDINFAITHRREGYLIGGIGLNNIFRPASRAELGYWLGVPYWGQGYGTEAARAVVGYGFEALGLNRIYAYHVDRNPASGRIMQKIGMSYEGRQRQHVNRWGFYEDALIYGILRDEYLQL
jgi:RimJ/RimL family protein N-acetyltransferase